MSARSSYRVTDQLWLWWLADSTAPVLIGELALSRDPRGVSVRYENTWIQSGFALSEDLPLMQGQVFQPSEAETAAGAVDDARPDRWGERVIRFVDRPPRLSLLEYLYFAGDDRFGALGVSTSQTRYEPRRFGPLPTLANAQAIHELVRKVLSNEPIPETQRRLISPGGTLGGAKPKALLEIRGEPWVVKFSDGDPIDLPLVEHASMTLAHKAQIRVATTQPIRLTVGHALAIKRFDRTPNGRRHALSAKVALRAAGEDLGYPQLAQLLRRRGVLHGDTNLRQMRELFRRVVFNILLDNTDDHEKNHALLVNDAEQYELSPAYDVLPSRQGLGYQQMLIGRDGADSTLVNALSLCQQFGLEPADAHAEVRAVAKVVSSWQKHFEATGVLAGDIDLLAEQIDRPFLRKQREQFSRR
jgi:serine/threonine-protein kinase HipA